MPMLKPVCAVVLSVFVISVAWDNLCQNCEATLALAEDSIWLSTLSAVTPYEAGAQSRLPFKMYNHMWCELRYYFMTCNTT